MTWQGPEGMTPPRARVRRAVRELHGVPHEILGALERQIREDPGLLLDAWHELKRAGRDTDRIVNRHVVRASAIVGDVLRALGREAGDRWRDQSDVAKGLVALLAEELRAGQTLEDT